MVSRLINTLFSRSIPSSPPFSPVNVPRITVVHSANDQFYLATSDDVSDASGEYYVSRRVYTPPPPAEDEEACGRLWKVLEDLSGYSYA